MRYFQISFSFSFFPFSFSFLFFSFLFFSFIFFPSPFLSHFLSPPLPNRWIFVILLGHFDCVFFAILFNSSFSLPTNMEKIRGETFRASLFPFLSSHTETLEPTTMKLNLCKLMTKYFSFLFPLFPYSSFAFPQFQIRWNSERKKKKRKKKRERKKKKKKKGNEIVEKKKFFLFKLLGV